MFTDFSGLVEVYTPAAGIVAGVAATLIPPKNVLKKSVPNNVLCGFQLNGLSGNNAYGDDYQAETNYPLVRLIASNGNVYYAFTHDDTTHSIAPGTFSCTQFDLNPTMPNGIYFLESVTNGIPSSNSYTVNVAN